jgi:hypothetical protein
MAYELIATTILTNSTTKTVTFTGIAQDAIDLEMRISARGDFNRGTLSINGSTSNQVQRRFTGNGSGFTVTTETNELAYWNQTAQTANIFGMMTIQIPDYTNASVNKKLLIRSVTENNATGAIQDLRSMVVSTTAAVSSLSLNIDSSATGFTAGTTVSLYKVY